MEKRILNKEIILYLIEKLGENIEGKKKLMKLMFLIEHYNSDKKKLVKEKQVGNDFIIYSYGVFSPEVMNSYLELIKENKIEDSFPMKIKNKLEKEDIPQNIKNKIDEIISLFGKDSGRSLEINTLKMLNLSLETKINHFGESVVYIIN